MFVCFLLFAFYIPAYHPDDIMQRVDGPSIFFFCVYNVFITFAFLLDVLPPLELPFATWLWVFDSFYSYLCVWLISHLILFSRSNLFHLYFSILYIMCAVVLYHVFVFSVWEAVIISLFFSWEGILFRKIRVRSFVAGVLYKSIILSTLSIFWTRSCVRTGREKKKKGEKRSRLDSDLFFFSGLAEVVFLAFAWKDLVPTLPVIAQICRERKKRSREAMRCQW
jgi:hypothetical protein